MVVFRAGRYRWVCTRGIDWPRNFRHRKIFEHKHTRQRETRDREEESNRERQSMEVTEMKAKVRGVVYCFCGWMHNCKRDRERERDKQAKAEVAATAVQPRTLRCCKGTRQPEFLCLIILNTLFPALEKAAHMAGKQAGKESTEREQGRNRPVEATTATLQYVERAEAEAASKGSTASMQQQEQ